MSVNINIYNQEGGKVDQMELAETVFNVEAKMELIHQAQVTQMANERQVLAHTKTRSEVRGGGKKPWRQKGTGNARAGSIRSPIWIGGGITFGPTKFRNFTKKINKKMKRKAVFMVLTDKVKNNNLLVLDKLEITEFKTKKIKEIFNNLIKEDNDGNKKKSILLVSGGKDEKIFYSARNLENVKVINKDNMNILDLLRYKYLITTAEAIKAIEQNYKKEDSNSEGSNK
ncbi:MAG: 50S ribosomal protein L4 [Patescibacteria group bacterium]